MELNNIKFSVGQISEIDKIVNLANKSYRGEESLKGWTSEANLLGGQRVNNEMISEILKKKNSLILIGKIEDEILAMIHGELIDNKAHFGLFAVDPNLQGKGFGRALLKLAEDYVIENWKVNIAVMDVIEVRKELIDFYVRCGYKITNKFIPFPESEIWNVKTENKFRLVIIEKILV